MGPGSHLPPRLLVGSHLVAHNLVADGSLETGLINLNTLGLYRENEKTLILLITPEYYLKFCQACKLAVVSVPEDDKVLLLLPHALEPVHLPHPAVGDSLEDEQGRKFIPSQSHLVFSC